MEHFETLQEGTAEAVSSKSGLLVLEPKPLRPYKTQDEYLYAMKEDLAEWFNTLYETDITVETFFEQLETGVLMCQHANNVQKMIDKQNWILVGNDGADFDPRCHSKLVQFRNGVKSESWGARDNVANFLAWCRTLGIMDVLLFETDDLVLRKNPKSVVLCLLEVARIGAKYGMLAPLIIQFEQEIEQEIEREQETRQMQKEGKPQRLCDEPRSKEPVKPPVQRITTDLRSLDDLVRELVSMCTCPTQIHVVRLAEGKYQIGDSMTTVFVRVLRSHVMVRVGGGWNTLENYLNKHDPCRCKSKGHGFGNGERVRRLSAPALLLDQMQISQRTSNISPSKTVERPSAQKIPRKASLCLQEKLKNVRSMSATRVKSGDRETVRKNLSGSLPRLNASDKKNLSHSRVTPVSGMDRGKTSSQIPVQNLTDSQRRSGVGHQRSWTTGSAAMSDSEADSPLWNSRIRRKQVRHVKRSHSVKNESLVFSRDGQGKHKLIEKGDNAWDFNKMIIETSQSIQQQMQALVGDGTSTEFSWSDTSSTASDIPCSESAIVEMMTYRAVKQKSPPEYYSSTLTRRGSREGQKPGRTTRKTLIKSGDESCQRARNCDYKKQSSIVDKSNSRYKISSTSLAELECNACGSIIGRKQSHLCAHCQGNMDVCVKLERRRRSEPDLSSMWEDRRSPVYLSKIASPRKDKHHGKPTRIPGPVSERFFALHRADSGVDINGGPDA